MAQIHPFEKVGLGKAPFRCVEVFEKTYQACPGAPVQPGGACHYCGTGIRYHYRVVGSDGSSFVVGSECVLKTTPKGSQARDFVEADIRERRREANRIRRDARRELKARERQREAFRKLRVFAREHRELLADLKVKHYIIRDIRHSLKRWGSISEKQIALVQKIAREEAVRVVEEQLPQVPCPTDGRFTIEGEVLSAKVRDSGFGPQLKIMVKVKTEAGVYRVWGSAPISIHEVDRGDRVQFTAAITRSHDDESFGFFKRPTKASILNRNQEAL